jgi:hypothetical protein
MKLSLLTLSFIPLASLSLGLNVTKANAQVTFPFEATYKTQSVFEPIQDDVFKLTVTGGSTDAPYSLDYFIRMNYVERNDNTGVESIVTDATELGIEGLPILTTTFLGSGNDKLFASISGTATRNVEDFTASTVGTATIIGGEGNFQGATGTLTLLENLTFNPNATTESNTTGIAVLKGSFTVPQAVPEPGNTTTLVVIGIIGASLLLRQRRKIICK